MDKQASDLVERLEDGARAIETDATPSQVGPSASDLRLAAALIRASNPVNEDRGPG